VKRPEKGGRWGRIGGGTIKFGVIVVDVKTDAKGCRKIGESRQEKEEPMHRTRRCVKSGMGKKSGRPSGERELKVEGGSCADGGDVVARIEKERQKERGTWLKQWHA